MKDVSAAVWVKDLIESQHHQSASLASAADATPKFAVTNRLKDEGPSRSHGALRGAHGGVPGCEARAGVVARSHDHERPSQEQDMKDVTRKLAHITSTPKAQLATKHANAVFRGYSDTISLSC